MTRGADGAHARIIGAIAGAVGGPGAAAWALAAMTDLGVKTVSLTITEKGYGPHRTRHGCDPVHPAVAGDLARPDAPTGALGLIVAASGKDGAVSGKRQAASGKRQAASGKRQAARTAPFSVLCCNNLQGAGALVKGALVNFARRLDPDLGAWVVGRGECRLPRQHGRPHRPPGDARTYCDAECLTGHADLADIETESFVQLVIEDDFPQGSPETQAGGAVFVPDVAPYQTMRLRMLNGAHSMMAYVGALSGRRQVRDVMADPALTALAMRPMEAAAPTLPPLPRVDPAECADARAARLVNPAIAHETRHIAMDGAEKLP
jgi:fructuronate reductase